MEKFNKRKFKILSIQLTSVAALIFIDLFIKRIVLENIALYERVDFIKGLFGWTYIQNTGVAWGMFDSNPQLLSVVTGVIIAAGLIWMILPLKRPLMYDICVPVIIAGGLANMIDRIMRGFVVDYIETLFIEFPIYNFADCLVVCGAFSLAFYLIYEIIRDYKAEKSMKQGGENKGE